MLSNFIARAALKALLDWVCMADTVLFKRNHWYTFFFILGFRSVISHIVLKSKYIIPLRSSADSRVITTRVFLQIRVQTSRVAVFWLAGKEKIEKKNLILRKLFFRIKKREKNLPFKYIFHDCILLFPMAASSGFLVDIVEDIKYQCTMI